MKLDQGYKNQAVGTAYFFRGFSMLWMVPYYGDDTNGGIPIILDTTPAAEIDSPRPAHVLQNYDQIISDMRTAGEMLPYLSQLDASQIGLPHKAAAWGYAARCSPLCSAVRREILRHRTGDVQQDHGAYRFGQTRTLHRSV